MANLRSTMIIAVYMCGRHDDKRIFDRYEGGGDFQEFKARGSASVPAAVDVYTSNTEQSIIMNLERTKEAGSLAFGSRLVTHGPH